MTYVSSVVSKERVYCLEQAGAMRCTRSFPLDVRWSVHIGAEDEGDAEILDWFVKEYRGKPPVSWRYRMKSSLSADGKLTISSGAGIKGYRATYTLW